jgi:hypothetical protein
MFTPISTYSPAEVDTRFVRAASAALRWGQGRLHTDMGTITLAGRLLR